MRKSFVTLLVASLASLVFADTVDRGPRWSNGSTYRGGGSDRIKFVYLVTDGAKSDEEASAFVMREGSSSGASHVWDDKWLYETVPPGGTLILGWYNQTRDRYGWVNVLNGNSWYWRTNDGNSGTCPDGGNKVPITFNSGGARIDIDLKNPRNGDGWTSNDLWYGFGY